MSNFPSWLWELLSRYLSIRDAAPLLFTSTKRPHLLCLSQKARNLWNPSALNTMTISTLLDRKYTPTPFACQLAELIQAIGVGYDDGKQTQLIKDEAKLEIFRFYLWFAMLPTYDVHVCCSDEEYVPPSQHKSALQAKETFVSSMSSADGTRRKDPVYVVCETPFKMLLTSGILETDLEFGLNVQGNKKPGRHDLGKQKGTSEEVVTYLKRLESAADVALVFCIYAHFDLAGGDGSMNVTLGYVSVRGTLVLLRRALCEYPASRHLYYKEWDFSKPNLHLPTTYDEIWKLLFERAAPGWTVAYGDNSTIYSVKQTNLMLNCPEFPQYKLGESLMKSAKRQLKG